jgi:SSS family solute:Na+ symporter
MHFFDFLIFAVYFGIVLYIGFYFWHKNKTREDYYVGNRSIPYTHVGMSIVATDVGGGFSIGLGGLGFLIGLSGSWLLFTGLVGAWLSAILVIPRIKKIDSKEGMLTFPDFLRYHYNGRVATAAAIISGIGYLGFTGGQILAGAKLAAGTIFINVSFMDPVQLSLYIMTAVVIIYTVLGGLKAVIYTDTFQWIILLGGLLFFGIPFAYFEVGGWQAMQQQLPSEFLTLSNITVVQFVNWFFTIVPIWFVAMTLYQRIFACADVKSARKAFYIAGILEYPLMAFIGVFLGMIAKIFFPFADAEMGMPMLLKNVLPIGVRGIVIAAYFSAILSTADSCLLASSGNFVNDIVERLLRKKHSHKTMVRLSQVITFIIGGTTFIIAQSFGTVLEIILHAYSFMVSGLLVPTLAAYFLKRKDSTAAFTSMFGGGTLTLWIIFSKIQTPLGLDASVFGILFSALLFIMVTFISKTLKKREHSNV